MEGSRAVSRERVGWAAAVLMLGLAAVTAACGGSPPSQELDAAAAALDNAEYARDCAPEEYRAAERLLQQARAASDAGDYDRARTLAESARVQAERARLTAQANREDCERRLNPPPVVETQPVVPDRGELQLDYDLAPVYFNFDAAGLDNRARETLQGHARYFSRNNYRIIVEGHCDHHGTDEYNLALGEARARTVAQYLVTLGIEPSRIQTISYGEFRPASATDTALNRRAEFRVRQ
jgi:peptidoglycan-associated lipoprotein